MGERTSLARAAHGLVISHIEARMKVKWLCAASQTRREASAADPVLHHRGKEMRYAEGAMN